MIYILCGFIIGLAINLLPVWVPSTSYAVFPEWHGNINLIRNIEVSPDPGLSGITLNPVRTQTGVSILSGSGSEIRNIITGEYMVSLSGSGGYVAKFEKVGKEVEFLNAAGERFWKVKSNEYPYLSYNGKLVILLNGDQSRIRLLNYNGNEAGAREIQGRLCTIISFSSHSDFAGVGFLDGSYYILDMSGKIISTNRVGDESVIKGIAISAGGDYAAVHYGNNRGDFVRLVDTRENEYYTVRLKSIHLSKTALDISDDGFFSVIDRDRILITDEEGNTETEIGIPPKEHGVSSIDCAGELCEASYTGTDGISRFLVFKRDGDILMSREFAGETFIESFLKGQAIFVRGSQGLYCYSYYLPAE